MLLQRQIEELALNNSSSPDNASERDQQQAHGGSTGAIVVPETKVKKKGIPKDVLINTKLLLT